MLKVDNVFAVHAGHGNSAECALIHLVPRESCLPAVSAAVNPCIPQMTTLEHLVKAKDARVFICASIVCFVCSGNRAVPIALFASACVYKLDLSVSDVCAAYTASTSGACWRCRGTSCS